MRYLFSVLFAIDIYLQNFRALDHWITTIADLTRRSQNLTVYHFTVELQAQKKCDGNSKVTQPLSMNW